MKIERESYLENKLGKWVKSKEGLYLKLLTLHISGLPDRICLLPGGIIFFAEIKTTKKKPRKIQQKIINKIKNLGFNVFIVDSSEVIEQISKQYGQT